MKLIRTSFLLLLLFNSIYAVASIPIDQAVKDKLINVKIQGSWDSKENSYYTDANGMYLGKCMTITIDPNAGLKAPILIPAGLILRSKSEGVSDMIVTMSQIVKFEKSKKETLEIYAMCIEMKEGVPHKKVKYEIGKMASPKLSNIARAIDKLLMQNVAGQCAIWLVTDKASKADLQKYDATDYTLELTRNILKEAGIKESGWLTPVAEPVDTIQTDSVIVEKLRPAKSGYYMVHPLILFGGAFLTLTLCVIAVLLFFRNFSVK